MAGFHEAFVMRPIAQHCRAAATAACGALLVAPAVAQSATVTIEQVSDGRAAMVFRAAPGEANDVTLHDRETSIQAFEQPPPVGSPPTITPTDPCFVSDRFGMPSSEPPANAASCPKPPALAIVWLEDGNDRGAGFANFLELIVHGGVGDDVVRGALAHDEVFGDAGEDTVFGSMGDDVVDGGTGADDVSGGDGIDATSYAARSSGVTVTLDDRAGDGEAGEGDNVRADVEDVDGTALADVIVGSAAANTLRGLDGDDALEGGPGRDRLDGGGGNDRIHSRDGSREDVACGAGQDTVVADLDDAVAPDCEVVEHPPPPVLVSTPAPAPESKVASGPDAPPAITVSSGPVRLKALRRRGLPLRVTCSEACDVMARLSLARKAARKLGFRAPGRSVRIGSTSGGRASAGVVRLTLRLTREAVRRLKVARRIAVKLEVVATDSGGGSTTRRSAVVVRR